MKAIGQGSSGTVYACPQQRDICLKKVNMGFLSKENSRGAIAASLDSTNLVELTVLRYLRGLRLPHVCTSIDTLVESESKNDESTEYYHVLPRLSGDAFNYFLEFGNSGDALVAALTRFVCMSIEGVEALGKNGVLHGDIRIDNFLVDHPHGKLTDVQLCDFGFARIVSPARVRYDRLLYSLPEQPPEYCAFGKAPPSSDHLYPTAIDVRSDWYAVAVTILDAVFLGATQYRFAHHVHTLALGNASYWRKLGYDADWASRWFSLFHEDWLDVKANADAFLLYGALWLLLWGFPPSSQQEWMKRAYRVATLYLPVSKRQLWCKRFTLLSGVPALERIPSTETRLYTFLHNELPNSVVSWVKESQLHVHLTGMMHPCVDQRTLPSTQWRRLCNRRWVVGKLPAPPERPRTLQYTIPFGFESVEKKSRVRLNRTEIEDVKEFLQERCLPAELAQSVLAMATHAGVCNPPALLELTLLASLVLETDSETAEWMFGLQYREDGATFDLLHSTLGLTVPIVPRPASGSV